MEIFLAVLSLICGVFGLVAIGDVLADGFPRDPIEIAVVIWVYLISSLACVWIWVV